MLLWSAHKRLGLPPVVLIQCERQKGAVLSMGVGDGLKSMRGNWSFGGETARRFDEHVARSVPLYLEGHDLLCDISDFFVQEDSVCYEVGCSTGTLTLRLAEHNNTTPNARFVGLDIEPAMIDQAEKKQASRGVLNASFFVEDATHFEFEPCDMIVCYYTVQFIRPSIRQNFVQKCYDSLRWGGAFLLFEKVRGPDARFQDMLTTLYSEYKLRQGYSAEEIVAKTQSLKGVLEPFSSQANVEMMQRAGFKDILTVQKYLSFEGFLAIK